MSRTSGTCKRLGVGSVGALTFLATPYMAGAALAAAPPAGTSATISIASQSTNTGSTRNDGTNSTVKISAVVTPPGSGAPAIASVRFSYRVNGSAAAPTVIGSDATAPYSIEWAAPAAGTYDEIAEALDASGTVIATSTKSAVAVSDYSAVHVTSPADGAQIGDFNNSIIVAGTRSADLPALSITATTIDNSDGSPIATGGASAVAAGTPAAGADQTWSTSVAVPACTNPAASGGCDVVITAVATGAGLVNGTSDEVVEATLYNQTLSSFTVTPPSATAPAGAQQTYTVAAADQNGKPIAGLTVNVTDNTAATETPATGTTDASGTFKFVGSDNTAETTTYTVKSQVGAAFDGNVDFTRTATLITYASTAAQLSFSVAPVKSVYAAQSEYTTTTSVAAPGTPVVDLCIVDQNGNPAPNSNGIPTNLVVTDTRTTTTGGTTTTGTATPVTPVQDTRTGKSNCYIIPKAAAGAVDYGTDTFNAYVNNDGTPGYQAGGTDVAAAPLTLKFAKLGITTNDTQAQTGTAGTVSFVVKGADGSPFANRKIALSLTGTDATFPTTQPSGTTYSSPTTATAVTDANGVITVSVNDTTAGNDVVTATDSITDPTTNQIATNVSKTATISYRTTSVALNNLVLSGGTLIQPGSNTQGGFLRPGDAEQYTVTLRDSTNQPLAGVSTTLTLDHGFFTPNCTNTANYETCTFDPAPAAGAPVGNLKSLGQSITATSDNSGQIVVTVAIGRDAGFDDDGDVAAILKATAGGASASASPIHFTTDGIKVLNGASVKLVAAGSSDKISGDVQLPAGTDFQVHLLDQFGNLVKTNTCAVTLAVTGGGTVTNTTAALARDCNNTTADGSFTTSNSDVYSLTSATTSTSGESDTVTATWPAPTTTFVAPLVVGNPFTDTTSTANKTDSFTVNLYAVDYKNLVYTFTSTPSNSVSVNTAVTTSVTVKDQKGNPVQGLCVNFVRSGPNDAAGNSQTGGSTPSGTCVATNAEGKAGTTYSSGTPGTATVTVVVTDGSGNELSRGVQTVTFTAGGSNNSTKPTITIDRTAMNVGQSAIITLKGTPGDSVQFFQRVQPATTFSLFRTFTFNSNGVVTINSFPRTNTAYFARTAAGDSSIVTLSVRPAVSLRGTAANRLASFNGVIVPGHGGVKVRIYVVSNGRVGALVASATTDGQGHYTASHQFAGHGRVTFIAQTISDNIALAGQSNRLTLTI